MRPLAQKTHGRNSMVHNVHEAIGRSIPAINARAHGTESPIKVTLTLSRRVFRINYAKRRTRIDTRK